MKMKKIFAVLLVAVVGVGLMLTSACTSQNTIAALVTTLGNASAAIATLEGNAALGTTLKADTAAAAAAVLSWKSGSASTEVIQALNLVEADLNLIPYTAPYSALIDIGIATVEEIITEVTAASPAPAASAFPTIKMVTPNQPHHIALTGSVPKDAAHFKKMWNKVAASDARLIPATIK